MSQAINPRGEQQCSPGPPPPNLKIKTLCKVTLWHFAGVDGNPHPSPLCCTRADFIRFPLDPDDPEQMIHSFPLFAHLLMWAAVKHVHQQQLRSCCAALQPQLSGLVTLWGTEHGMLPFLVPPGQQSPNIDSDWDLKFFIETMRDTSQSSDQPVCLFRDFLVAACFLSISQETL